MWHYFSPNNANSMKQIGNALFIPILKIKKEVKLPNRDYKASE